MTLEFRPLPYENPEPTGSQYAQMWGQSLNQLGQTFQQNNAQERQAGLDALTSAKTLADLRSEYGDEGMAEILGQIRRPQRRLSLFQKPQPEPFDPRAGMGQLSGSGPQPIPMPGQSPMAQPGQPGFDENAYAQRFGTRRLKMFQDREDRALNRRKTEAEIEKLNRGPSETSQPNTLEAYLTRQVQAGNMTVQEAQRQLAAGKPPAEGSMGDPAYSVPGLRRTGNTKLSELEIRNIREGLPEYQTFRQDLAKYKAYVDRYGTQEMTDRGVQSEMKALANSLQLKMKKLGQLGVLSASDIPFIKRQIPDPAFWATESGITGALDATFQQNAGDFRNKLTAAGYEPEDPSIYEPAQYQFPDQPADEQAGGVPSVGGVFNGERVISVERID